MSDALTNLAEASVGLGEHHRAVEYCGRVLGILDDYGDRTGRVEALLILGRAQTGANRPVLAREALEEARVLMRPGDRRIPETQRMLDELTEPT